MGKKAYLVTIRCRQCGERFILKGTVRKGKIETGFKQCLCKNAVNLDISSERL